MKQKSFNSMLSHSRPIAALAWVVAASSAFSVWAVFQQIGVNGSPNSAPSLNTVYSGHLIDAGSSDNWATGWTYARYYGPPAKGAYAVTAGKRYSSGSPEAVDVQGSSDFSIVTSYISTGSLFSSSTWDWATSQIETTSSSVWMGVWILH